MALVESGTLTRRNAKTQPVPYEVHTLNMSHLEKVMEIQMLVIKNIAKDKYYEPDDEGLFRQGLKHDGLSFGMFIEDRIAGYMVSNFPEDAKIRNYGEYLELPESEMSSVINFESSAVHPDFRGLGINGRLKKLAVHELANVGRDHVIGTVSPYNLPSLKASLSAGVAIRKLKSLYGGRLRYVYHVNYKTPYYFDKSECIFVEVRNLKRQHELLSQGYAGITVRGTMDYYEVGFALPKHS